MAITMHWGKWVSDNVPVGGVVNVNRLEGVIHDLANNGIDLGFAPGWEEFKLGKCIEFLSAYWDSLQEDDLYDEIEPDAELIAEWKEEYAETYDQPGLILIGDWVKDEAGLYDPDPAGEFAAIVDYDANVVAVKHSKVTKRCALCSPCYPGQGDLESEGDYLAYDLPAYFYPQPDLYTITIQVRRVVDGVVQNHDWLGNDGGLFSATAQAPRGNLREVTIIASNLWNLADDQLRSIPQ